ncbi:MAG TPA: LysM peptidoglycan-binding domain-containing protein [Aggregatilineaceae bacterium]|nr:LysM peptidoglycan-binding domain-containing protein [Aggregatilineaceae bacterium]
MAQPDLIDAFDDCIERLRAGQSINDCLRAYPRYAVDLRVMLEAGLAVQRANPAVSAAAKARVRARVMQASSTMPPARRSRPWMAAAAALIAVAAAIFILLNREDKGLHTVPLASVTVSATATETPSLTASPTSTRTPSPSRTPSPTVTICVPTPPAGWVNYTIQFGDNLPAIALAHNVSTEQLIEVNCIIDPNALIAGTSIFVPPTVVPLAPQSTQDSSGSSGSDDNEDHGESDDHSSSDDHSGLDDHSGSDD